MVVESLADGRIIAALGRATQSGFELDYVLADALLPMLVAAAARQQLKQGYAAVVSDLRAMAERSTFDDGLPSMVAIVAVCSIDSIELSWVGHCKAYVVRGREIIAENIEHSHWRTLTPDMLERVRAHEIGQLVLGVPSREIQPHGCTPDSLRLPPLGPVVVIGPTS